MKSIKTYFAPLALLIALVAVAAFGQRSEASAAAESADSAHAANWLTDFATAQAQAQTEDKPLLLLFTGSDWCPPCQALEGNVFSKEAFQTFAERELILVELDFPRRKAQSDEQKAHNQALAEEFAIRGFPTVILLSPEGELIGQTGFRRGSAEGYVQHLRSLLASAP
jgi:protein disulfide-isomerase